MTRRQAAIHLAHLLGIGVLRAEYLIDQAERQSPGRHAWAVEPTTANERPTE